jgi:WD40 repeat protein
VTIQDDEGRSADSVPDPATDDLDESDYQLLSQLAYFDEAMASGATPAPLDFANLSSEQIERLKAIQDCLVLLAQARRSNGEPNHSASTSPPPLFGDQTADGAASPSGARIGRFELVRRLGIGGTAVVYLANDAQGTGQVAVKIPLPSWFASGDVRERFVREAEAAARLSHPNIVTVYEVGEFPPVWYIASEYCAGPSLAAFLEARDKPVAGRAAAEVVAKLADAMQHAHARGVLHRDLKPSNIFLVPAASTRERRAESGDDIGQFTPKIGDFGLAKLREHGGGDTRSGAVLGTVLYMSPEQAKGSVHEITVQTDVYALGAILYTMLTGAPPFQGATDVDTLQMIVSADPAAPRRLRGDVPSDLSAICLKCLEKSPAKRYASAAELAADLRCFLRNEPTIARAQSALGRATRWVRRYPAYTALIALSVVALATVLGTTIAYNSRLRGEATKTRQLLYSSDVRLAQDAWDAGQFQNTVGILARHIPGPGQPDLRELGWHYLWKQCSSELRTFHGHIGDAYSVRFSPDGKSLLSGGKDKTVRLWDIRTGKLARTLTGHRGEVNTVVMTSGGFAASASDDGTVRAWDMQTGRQLACLDAREGAVYGLAAPAKGDLLASGGVAGRIHLWDLQTGTRLWTSDARPGVDSLAFSNDGRSIVSGHSDGTIRLWEGKTGRLIHEATTGVTSPMSAVYSPSLSSVAVAGRTGFLGIYEASTDGLAPIGLKRLDQKAIGIHGLAFSPRDNTLAIGRRDGLVELWNAGQRLKRSHTLPGHDSRVWSVAWSPDGKLLASAAASGDIKLWNATRSRNWCDTYPRLPSAVSSIAVSRNAKSIITSSRDGFLREWDRASRRVRRIAGQQPGTIAIADYSGDENAAIAIGPGTSLQRWDLTSGDLTSLAQLPETALSHAVSGDRKLVAVGCEHSTAVLFDVERGQLRHRLKTSSLDVEHVALSPEGKRLATSGVGEEIELWNTQTGRRERTLPGHANRTLCMTFSPDGLMLASGGSDENICLWDVATGRRLATLAGHAAAVTTLAISPNGRNLASGSSQPASIQLWDLITWQPLIVTPGYPDSVTALSFTRDGRAVIVGSAGGHLLEFSLDNQDNLLAGDSPASRVALQPQMLGQKLPEAPSDRPGCIEVVQAVHDYARRSGFVTGYPTFHRGHDGEAATAQIVLLKDPGARMIRVSLDEFCEAFSFSRSTSQDVFTRLLQTADSWFTDKGYHGALPSFFAEHSAGNLPQFEIALLSGEHCQRREMALNDVKNPSDVESVFREVHSWAVKSGFFSGFPTFQQQSGRLMCVVLDPDQAEVREVLTDELNLDRRE